MATFTDAQIRECVVNSLHESVGILNDPEIVKLLKKGEDIRLDKIEIDSLCQFEIIMDIEEKLSVELDADEVFSKETLNSLTKWLASQMNSDAG